MRKFYQLLSVTAMLIAITPACKKNRNPITTTTLEVKTQVTATGIPEILNAVHFINEQVGFVGDVSGGIYKTTDAGKTWVAQNSTANTAIRSFYFTDAATGFAVGGESTCITAGCTPPGGYVLRTTNGGQTWAKVNDIVSPTLISSIYFTSASVGYCISYNTIYQTTNGGISWAATPFANLGTIMTAIKFTDAQHGYVTCATNKIIQTTNGGINWQVGTVALSGGYNDVATGNGYTYIAGQQKAIKSTDAGLNWQLLPNSYINIYFLHFIDAQQGVAFGWGNYSGGDFGVYYPGIYTTADGGDTWTAKVDIKDFGIWRGISFPLSNLGYGIDNHSLVRLSINTTP
jgi:photosystem II stability/assembly factor-like uncharacterized protein